MESKPLDLTRLTPWLLIVYSLVLFCTSGQWGVIETSEARYAEIAREMLQTGDWLHPVLLNIFHYHKPPVTYWLTAVAFEFFGVNPFSVRFFLQVSLIIQVWIIYRITRQLFAAKRIALFAAIIYATLPLVLVSIRGLTTDAFLTTFVLLLIYGWLMWRRNGNSCWLYFAAIAGGIGFLTKGPLILIAPICVAIGFQKLLPSRAFSFHHILAILVFLVISFSWYLLLIFENENFISYFLYRQTVERVTNAEVFSRHQPFWYYLLWTSVLTLPWTALLVIRFAKGKWRDLPVQLRKIIIFWILLPIIFFSLVSSKLVLYVLPSFPGLAIVIAAALEMAPGNSRRALYLPLYFAAILLACCFAFKAGFVFHPDLILICIAGMSLLIAAKYYKDLQEPDRMVMYAFIFTIALLIYGARFMHYNELKINSTRPLAEWIRSQGLDTRNVIVYNRMLPSLAFHLRKSILSLDDGNRYLQREVNFEKNDQWKKYLFHLNDSVDRDRVAHLLKNHPGVLVVKGEFSPGSQWIQSYMHHKKVFDDWTIYY